jgi:hypothetical protein
MLHRWKILIKEDKLSDMDAFIGGLEQLGARIPRIAWVSEWGTSSSSQSLQVSSVAVQEDRKPPLSQVRESHHSVLSVVSADSAHSVLG